MTSSTDSMAQRLETDSCPARPRSAGTAGFSMSLPRVYDYRSKQRPQADSLFQSVPPPPPLMSTETYLWKYPEYRFYDLRFASKVFKRTLQKRPGSSGIRLHSDWR